MMTRELTMFVNALRDACGDGQALDAFDEASCPQACIAFEIDEMEVLLLADEARPKDVTLYCVFGDVPEADAAAIWRRLLEVNLALACERRSGFGLDAETRQAIYAFTITAEPGKARALLATLEDLARHARRWRQTHFMDATSAADAKQALLAPAQLA